MFFLMEYTWDVSLHSSTAYVAMAIGVPVALAMISRASQHRWAATIAASVYTIFVIGEILILPLFSAQPKLGPVYFPVTHFVPAKFPILIIAPALALDLLWKRTRSWKSWQVALLSGLVFVAVLVAVEWPFASFLMTPAAANRFFGTIYFDYNSPSWGVDRMRRVLAARAGHRALSRVGNRRDLRLDQHLDRTWLRRMDAEGPALKAFRVILLFLVCVPQIAFAHVGSKDVFQQVTAGPYKLFVTVRMPNVIPGVANVEVRSTGARVTAIADRPTATRWRSLEASADARRDEGLRGRSRILYRRRVDDEPRLMAGTNSRHRSRRRCDRLGAGPGGSHRYACRCSGTSAFLWRCLESSW